MSYYNPVFNRCQRKISVKTTPLMAAMVTALALLSVGCSKTDAPAASNTTTSAVQAAQSYDVLAAEGKGFTVGAMMSANTVYVLFDPQCPHCGHLWNATQPLLKSVKFVWLPVSIINGNSGPQGAALLSAADPAQLMTVHETSLLAGTGGLPVTSGMSAEAEQAIKKNTQLFSSMGGESVPYIVAKNPLTGKVVTNSGALPSAELADFLGINRP